jgi:hypothetical protein
MKTLSVNCHQCKIPFQKSICSINQGIKNGYIKHFCSNECSILFNRIRQQELKQNRIEEYYKNPKRCPQCNGVLKYKSKKTYCSSKCFAIYTQKDGGHKWSEEGKKKLSEWGKIHAYRVPRNRTERVCPSCKNVFEVTPSQNRKKCCSRKCSSKWIKESGYYKNKGRGGFRPNSGTSKKGWYKGYFCGSSWELAWLIYQLEHGVIPERNKKGFKYSFDNKEKLYYPDFKIGDEYIEIKGYHSKQVDAKTSQFPHKLSILHKANLMEVFEYVEEKYGKNYINLYEK